jgi:hypothetical protein
MADNPQGIDSTPKAANTPVKSGSGTRSSKSVNADAVAAGDFAYGALGSGTAGGLGNAALLDTRTILPNTKRTQVSKAQLEAADKEYTRQMNLLSQHWSVGDTSSPGYLMQKENAMKSQYQWELARNDLEEVASDEIANSIAPIDFGSAELPIKPVDLTGLADSIQLPDLNAPEEENAVKPKPKDQRVRLAPKERGGNGQYPFFGDKDSVLFQLNETNGVFFPYTPTITYQHKASYSEMVPTHANTSYHVYNNTPAIQIQIEAQFTSQNLAEARYTLAAMHFFRSATKMHFGSTDPEAGLPPPPLVLSGYGDFMFNELTVILTDFSMSLPNNVDYLEVDIGGHTAWVPSLTTFNVTCVVQQTPKQQRDQFNLRDFTSGKMMSSGTKGWI